MICNFIPTEYGVMAARPSPSPDGSPHPNSSMGQVDDNDSDSPPTYSQASGLPSYDDVLYNTAVGGYVSPPPPAPTPDRQPTFMNPAPSDDSDGFSGVGSDMFTAHSSGPSSTYDADDEVAALTYGLLHPLHRPSRPVPPSTAPEGISEISAALPNRTDSVSAGYGGARPRTTLRATATGTRSSLRRSDAFRLPADRLDHHQPLQTNRSTACCQSREQSLPQHHALRRTHGWVHLPLCVIRPQPRPAPRSGVSLVGLTGRSGGDASDAEMAVLATTAHSGHLTPAVTFNTNVPVEAGAVGGTPDSLVTPYSGITFGAVTGRKC